MRATLCNSKELTFGQAMDIQRSPLDLAVFVLADTFRTSRAPSYRTESFTRLSHYGPTRRNLTRFGILV